MRPYVLASGAVRAPFRTLDYTEEALPIPLHRSAPPSKKRPALGAFALSVATVIAASACVAYSVTHWLAPAIATTLVSPF
jgi:hypothetical protein